MAGAPGATQTDEQTYPDATFNVPKSIACDNLAIQGVRHIFRRDRRLQFLPSRAEK